MRSQGLRSSTVAAVVSHAREPSARWYIRTLAHVPNARIETIRMEDCPDAASLTLAVRRIARIQPLGLLVVEWPSDTGLAQAALDVGTELHVPTLLLRDRLTPCSRVVVATDGGANAIDLLWIAQQLASSAHLPVRVLRLRPPALELPGPSTDDALGAAMQQVMSRMVGLNVQVETLHAADPVAALEREVRQGETLLMGAPSPLRVATGFEGTFPDAASRRVSGTLLLVGRRASAQPCLRRLLWGRLARPGLRAANKREAIEQLVENLVQHNQIPSSSRTDFVERAMDRERLMPTAVGSQAAFPHVRLRDFSGVAASFGVFPDGVDFGSDDGNRSRFICFMVSPYGFYEDYLAILARFARRIVVPDVREGLLRCETATEVVDLLAPRLDVVAGDVSEKPYVLEGVS